MLALTVLLASTGLYPPAETPRFETGRSESVLGDLPVAVTWPKKAGASLPVIVWSHGMYGSRSGYKVVAQTLAGAGYVVIQPTHGDSYEYLTAEQRRALLAKPNTNNTQSWDERPGQVSNCIDGLAKIGAQVPELKGRLDESRVAVGGHSFGAWTTQALAGMELTALGRTKSFYEPRAKAFVVLSGSGPGGPIKPEGLQKMHGPMLFITGTNDTARTGDTGEWRKRAFELAAPGDKWLVWIEGATHSFGGLSGARGGALAGFLNRSGKRTADDPKHTRIVLSAMVSFLDSYVGKDAAATRYVKDKTLEKVGGVTVVGK